MSKRYGREAALNGVNLRVPDGARCTSWSKPTGRGTSTTIKALMNLERADAFCEQTAILTSVIALPLLARAGRVH